MINDDVWHIIDPSDPTQAGFWRIPFNSSISANLVYMISLNTESFLNGFTIR